MDMDFLSGIVPDEQVFRDEPMHQHTTFRAGGCADALITTKTESELVAVLAALRANGIAHLVIGRGSNLLVADSGFRGVFVRHAAAETRVQGNLLEADAGATLRQLYEAAVSNGLSGLEFAGGIPGSVGGGIAMNAGAYGGELRDTVELVRVCDRLGNVRTLNAEEMQFGYRTSAAKTCGYTVLSASFRLPEGAEEQSRARAAELAARRKARQPLEKPSAGSVFKRPPGHFAGSLIEQCGLKGARAGGAQVSPKHAGFIVNEAAATASDIYRLIREVQHTVHILTGVKLEPEIQFVGDFDA